MSSAYVPITLLLILLLDGTLTFDINGPPVLTPIDSPKVATDNSKVISSMILFFVPSSARGRTREGLGSAGRAITNRSCKHMYVLLKFGLI